MAFKKKPPEPDEEPGAPEWMLTFSDCMTLLLTFFVLLLTFSDIGRDTIPALSNGFRRIMPGFKLSDKMYRNTLSRVIDAEPVEATLQGSEHATLEQGTHGSIKETTELDNPLEPRVFMIPSVKIFAGRASAISPQGRHILDTIAAYLRRVPNGVIIGERSGEPAISGEQIGLMRASAAADYLITKGGLESRRLGISSSSSAVNQGFVPAGNTQNKQGAGSTLEIVLLGLDINK